MCISHNYNKTLTCTVVSLYPTANSYTGINQTEQNSLFTYTQFIYCQGNFVDILMQDITFYPMLL